MSSPRLWSASIHLQKKVWDMCRWLRWRLLQLKPNQLWLGWVLCHFNRELTCVFSIIFIHFHIFARWLWWMCVKFNINEFKLASNRGGKNLICWQSSSLIYQSAAGANILASCRSVLKSCWLFVFFYFKHVKYQLHGLMLCYDANLIITFCKLTTRNCLVEQRTSSIHDFSFQITHEKYFFLRSVEFQEFLTQSLDRLRVKVLIECTDCQPNS